MVFGARLLHNVRGSVLTEHRTKMTLTRANASIDFFQYATASCISYENQGGNRFQWRR